MREIPPLQVLCLRAIGPHSCSVEATFAKDKDGQPSTASRLLQSYLKRGTTTDTTSSINAIPLGRWPCIGAGAARRLQGNEVDMHHPFAACLSNDDNVLVLQYNNPALDCLQAYIDSLVELGRMDDCRLGLHFFTEFKANANGLCSLSLYNCTISGETIEYMMEANIGPCLACLDLTGVRGLTDDLLEQLLPSCKQLKALSIKNCRRLTSQCCKVIGLLTNLERIDVGGAYNLKPDPDLLELVPKLPKLTELHASGLGWTDSTLEQLCELRSWNCLSLSFSLTLSHTALRQSLSTVSSTLRSLALAFCESTIDNIAMGLLGRNLPHVTSLDIRGNPVSTLTGWYDGRVSADLPVQALIVLARYSALTEASVEETKRVHPVEAVDLTVILDDKGIGVAIQRREDGTDEIQQ